MEGGESGEITFCGYWFGRSHNIDKPEHDWLLGCGEVYVIVVYTEGFVGSPWRVVAPSCRGEGVIKEIFSFWRKVDILMKSAL
jgi:hypothetical protein